MIHKVKGIATWIALFLLFNGCYYDNEEELYPGSADCDVSSVDFNLDIKPIIQSNCAISGCHVPGTGRQDLTTNQGVLDVALDGRLKQRVVILRDMPPSGGLTSCEIQTIEAWVDGGATIN